MEITCESDFTKLTVAILKKELERRELDTKGKKADLIERLAKYLQSNKESSPIASKQQSPSKTETSLSPATKVAAISPTLPSPTKDSQKNVVDTKEPSSPIKNQNPNHIKEQSEIPQKKEISSPVKSKETMPVKRPAMQSSPAPKKARLEAFTAIHLEKFTRPLNIEALREKVSDYGEIEKFWMNKIRSISYIVYKTYDQAEAAIRGLQGYEFQPSIPLNAKLVSLEQVEKGIKESIDPAINPFPPVEKRVLELDRSSSSSQPSSLPIKMKDEIVADIKYTKTLPSIMYKEK